MIQQQQQQQNGDITIWKYWRREGYICILKNIQSLILIFYTRRSWNDIKIEKIKIYIKTIFFRYMKYQKK